MTGSPEPIATELPRLHLVTDAGVLRSPGFLDRARELVAAGGPGIAFHLRAPGFTGREVWELAEPISKMVGDAGAWLVVNDRLDVALGSRAHAVQLGHASMPSPAARRVVGPGMRIGVSVHSPAEAIAAVHGGADYLLAGTLYESASHPGAPPSGLGWLAEVGALGVPVIGIGGIGAGRVRQVREAGAHGVAVIGAIWRAPDPLGSLGTILDQLE